MNSHLAQACVKVAEVNHYLVNIVGTFSIQEFDDAESELIDCENIAPETTNFDLAFLVLSQLRKAQHGF